jgi:hypothetical protein
MMADGAVRVAMWSGPRNISTAMMRSFENRPDCVVWDEPFYAHYLAETGLDHPLAERIIATHETNWRAVAARATGPVPDGKAIFYQKHMTHHILPHLDLACLDGLRHAFLIREPARVLMSYVDKRADVTLADLGFAQQKKLFDAVHQGDGRPPPVLDADDVLSDPEGMLRALCLDLAIPFHEAMLSWPAGRRDSDGLWAAHWYGSVEQSTGFVAPKAAPRQVPEHLTGLLAEAEPYYQALRPHRLKPA